MAMRIGADVGGTFTDVVLEVEDDSTSGPEMFSTKVLTTYEAPEQGILDGVRTVAAEAGANLADLDTFIHGTTLATNALISRTGARTALVTTDGFRDTIEMRTESRFEQYDLNLVLPAPLIQRSDRHVLRERLAADGTVLRPFDEEEARLLVEALADRPDDEAYEAVAVGFIHAYVDGTHERRFRDLLLERLPDVAVSISSAESTPDPSSVTPWGSSAVATTTTGNGWSAPLTVRASTTAPTTATVSSRAVNSTANT